MSTTISPNMSLPIPVVSQQPGPDYASNINECLETIDSHDHASGSGVPITPNGINITSDLPFNNNDATSLRTTRFQDQSGTLSSSGVDIRCLYFSNGDLYANDGSGNIVRITQSGGVVGAAGNIANLASPASASYVSAQAKFTWQSNVNTAADLDFRSAILRNSGAGSFGMTVQAPTLGANQTVTLPSTPGESTYLSMTSAGVIEPSQRVTKGIVYSAVMSASTASGSLPISLGTVTFTTTRANTYPIVSFAGFESQEAYIENSIAGGFANVTFYRNSSAIMTLGCARTGASGISRQPLAWTFIDKGINNGGLPIGSFSYRVEVVALGGASVITVSNGQLTVLES